MQVLENYPLTSYTSFFIGGPSRFLVFAQDEPEVLEAIELAKDKNLPLLILGGGSNILVSDNGFNGLAVRIENIGIDIENETDETITIKVASGEVWDDVVRFAVEQNWWGMENLSHIPGFTGAISVQNVGAYGQEASDVVQKVRALDLQTNQIVELSNKDLNFGYRTSIFNTTQKNRYIILETFFELQKHGQANLAYKDLAEYFAAKQITEPTIQEVRDAVIKIRDQKFPFPSKPEQGNSGSFFRGPLLTETELENVVGVIKTNFGDQAAERLQNMKSKLKVPQGYKTPGAFLVELCNLTEQTFGGAKVNTPQPAIIVNHTGKATANDVLNLFKLVRDEVLNKTGVRLGIEPELIGFSSEELTIFGLV